MKLNAILSEARKPHLKYNEKRVKGEIDKVMTALEGSESASVTKLAKKFNDLDLRVKALSEKRKDANEKLTDEIEKYFDDTTDIIYTRIVHTASFVVQVAKQEAGQKKTEVDYEAIYKGLVNLIPSNLLPMVDDLFLAHTKSWTQDPRKPSLKVTPNKVDEGILDAASGKLMVALERTTIMFKNLLKKAKDWGKTYDAELADIKKML